MPELTRRHRHNCWHIYYGDVHVGTIAERVGNPHDTDPWEWSCGFYPGSHPGEHRSNTIATFEEARADFERAWLVFLSDRTDTDFQAWRGERDWTERKICAVGRWQAPGAAKLWTGQAVQPFYEMPLRRGLRHARPGRGADACSAHHGDKQRIMIRLAFYAGARR